MSKNIIWMDGGFLFEINKQYNDLGQEAVLTNQMCIIKLFFSENCLSHWSQEYFTPSCFDWICMVKVCLCDAW